jgi:hypothetical protein
MAIDYEENPMAIALNPSAPQEANKTLEWIGCVAGGTLYSLCSFVAGGPLLAIGNGLVGYRYLPAMGHVGEFTAATTGQVGTANLFSFDFLKPDKWQAAAPDLGMMAICGAGSSAVLATIAMLHQYGESRRAQFFGDLHMAQIQAKELRTAAGG